MSFVFVKADSPCCIPCYLIYPIVDMKTKYQNYNGKVMFLNFPTIFYFACAWTNHGCWRSRGVPMTVFAFSGVSTRYSTRRICIRVWNLRAEYPRYNGLEWLFVQADRKMQHWQSRHTNAGWECVSVSSYVQTQMKCKANTRRVTTGDQNSCNGMATIKANSPGGRSRTFAQDKSKRDTLPFGKEGHKTKDIRFRIEDFHFRHPEAQETWNVSLLLHQVSNFTIVCKNFAG